MSQTIDKFIKENLELCEAAGYGDFRVSASHVLPQALKALEIAVFALKSYPQTYEPGWTYEALSQIEELLK